MRLGELGNKLGASASEGDELGNKLGIILQRGAESEADRDKTRWNQAGCGLWAAGAADLILQASESASVWAECGGTVLTMPAIVKLK